MTINVGVIGCGQISSAYLRTLTEQGGDLLRVSACADLSAEAAKERAREFGVPQVLSTEALLADPEITFVANLTIPEAHFEITRAALQAGKHVYTEKPLALTQDEACSLHRLAEKKGCMLSCAPDTLLGEGNQRTRALIDEGIIGTPASAFAQIFMGKTAAARYLRRGVGTLLDMGPYYIAAMIYTLGPVVRVTALGTRPEITPRGGKTFVPEEPARAGVVLEFASGPLGLLSTQSFGPGYEARMAYFGQKGTLACPDPNKFAGEWTLQGGSLPEDTGKEPSTPYTSRGAGLLEMAQSLRAGRACHLNADFSLHCAEVLLAAHASVFSGEARAVKTTCERPDPTMLPNRYGSQG